MNTEQQNHPSSPELTCFRCNHEWIRRNMNKLPKSCPRCGSQFWNKPLTPYWAAYHKQQAKQKQAEIQELTAAKKRIQQFQAGNVNQKEYLILYTCSQQLALEPIKAKTNFWLPENMTPQPSPTELYQISHTIATTSGMASHVIRDMISKEQLPHNKVFWINIEGNQQYINTFAKDGTIQTWNCLK